MRQRRSACARPLARLFARFGALALQCALVLPLPAAAAPDVGLLTVDGAIGPASADYVVRGIARAAQARQQLVVIELDTPGGLDISMRRIIKAILASPVPVATFVAPGGARAASAGTYILYASHVAAMAPGTNLGAATPVQVGIGRQPGDAAAPDGGEAKGDTKGDAKGEAKGKAAPGSALERKQMHDAAAYLRGLAQLRGRNADWAERAVRESVSLTAEEALEQGVIDVVADDVPDLLKRLDGKTVQALGITGRLDTGGAALVAFEPDWRTRRGRPAPCSCATCRRWGRSPTTSPRSSSFPCRWTCPPPPTRASRPEPLRFR